MELLANRLDRLDVVLTRWMAHHSITLLRVGLGLVFIWFGALKFVPSLSPAQDPGEQPPR
jgi:uncharacterized membrane protein YkgB